MDRGTEGTWSVERKICQACRVRDAVMDNDAAERTRPRGVKYVVTRTQLPEGEVEDD